MSSEIIFVDVKAYKSKRINIQQDEIRMGHSIQIPATKQPLT